MGCICCCSPVAVAAAPAAAGDEPSEEKTEFDVVLMNLDQTKLLLLKKLEQLQVLG